MFIEKSTPIRSKHVSDSETMRISTATARSCSRRSASSRSSTSLDHVGRLVHDQGAADVEVLDLAGPAHAVPRVRPDHARS